MAQSQIYGYPLLRSLLISGAIALLPLPAIAQRVPIADDTLGNERSIVSPDQVIRGVPSSQIDGGARRGANLFHSFREFNIDAGRGAYFTNPDGVANIITRVTGNSRSDILGTLGILGNANLFLINPNGILFGQNARLDIGGSFVSSTADSIGFDNGFAFSATDPQAPTLLTVNVPIGLQYGRNPGEIQVQQGATLRVPNDPASANGQTLMLVGGAVTVDGGELLAPGGRVELAGVAAPRQVGLTQQGQEWRLSVPEGLARADVKIRNDANVSVRSGGGGSIVITAHNFTVSGAGTRVQAGIAEGQGTFGVQAEDININASEAVDLNASLVSNEVRLGGTGNAGNIRITTGSLSLTNGAKVLSGTRGQGDAGNITIRAMNAVSFNGVGSNGLASGASSSVSRGGIGQGGNINITTGNFSLLNGSQVSTSTVGFGFGQGDAGNITIRARNAMSFDGVGSSGFPSGAFSVVLTNAIGQGGDINITTDSLSLSNGAVVDASTYGRGDAGSVTIAAKDAVSFDGISRDGRFTSNAASIVYTGAIGQGGNVRITTGRLSLTHGGQVVANTLGQGDAGNIYITARDRVVMDGADRYGFGFASNASSAVEAGAIGQGGDIRITTGRLSLMNGAGVTASASGQGDAGNIMITARNAVSIAGVISNGSSSSGVYSVVNTGAIGQGGDIRITTGRLSLMNGGQLVVGTRGRGNAGNIIVIARDAASFAGINRSGNQSAAVSTVESGAIGRGGNIRITTDRFSLFNGAQMSASTLGQGNAGNIIVAARDTVSFDGAVSSNMGRNSSPSSAISEVKSSASGRGGNIRITTDSLAFTNGAGVSSSTAGRGNAGNITITARDQVSFDGVDRAGSPGGAFTSVISGAVGRGGRIRVNTDQFSITNGSTLTASSQGRGRAGNLDVNSRQLRLDNLGSIQAETRSGQGGDITLQVPELLLLRNQSRISTTAGTARAGGNGGNITFNGQFIVAAPNENSDISANAFTGRGGNVEINAQSIFGIQSRSQPNPLSSDITASSESGIAGVVDINTPDVDPSRGLVQLPVEVTDASRLIAQTCPTGKSVNQQNQFIVTGRGGLPPIPSEAMNRDAIQVDLVTAHAEQQPSVSHQEAKPDHSLPESPIAEAQGWQVAADGKVILVAAAPTNSISLSSDRLSHCR